jgi:hypothetical protein
MNERRDFRLCTMNPHPLDRSLFRIDADHLRRSHVAVLPTRRQ